MSEENKGNIIPGEAESEARAQGWAPKDEWNGDPNKWVDADTFIERGEKIWQIQRERMNRQIQEQKAILEQMRQTVSKAEESGYRRALSEIDKRQREAVQTADTEAYDAAERERHAVLQQYRDSQSQAQAQAQAQAQIDPDFEEWRADNPWFDEDHDLQAYAMGISHLVQKELGGVGGRKLYNEVTKRVKKVFPHKFQNSRRSEPSAVEGATSSGGKKASKGFDDLPADAKKAYEKFARQIPGFSKEEYVKNYIWD